MKSLSTEMTGKLLDRTCAMQHQCATHFTSVIALGRHFERCDGRPRGYSEGLRAIISACACYPSTA
jgi:hypothetical protein